MTLLRIIIFLNLILFSDQELFGQQKIPRWVKKIEQQIGDQKSPPSGSIFTDSSFWDLSWRLRKSLKINYFSSFTLDTLPNGIERLSLGIFNSKRQLEDLLRGRYFLLFFEENKILKVSEFYNNNSRMGSCGNLTITHSAYFKNNEIKFLETKEEPFVCYGDPPDSLLLLRLGRYFLESRKFLTFNLFFQEIEKYKAEINYKPKENPSLLDQKIDIEAYELKWVKRFLESPFQPNKNGNNIYILLPFSTSELIGEKYLIGTAMQISPPMGIQPYTLYYFERKE